MNRCFTKGLSSPIPIAASTLAATLALVSGPTVAQAYSPHRELTPYQIVADDGRCIQATAAPAGQAGWVPLMQPCNPNIVTQKFYLLDNATSDTEFVPQVDKATHPLSSPNARIVLASEFDRTTTGHGYSFLYRVADNYSYLGSSTSPTSPLQNSNYTWTVTKMETLIDNYTGNWDWVANEGSIISVAGSPGWREVRYGVGNSWNYRIVTIPPNGERIDIGCNNETFGDPDRGKPKTCEVLKRPASHTPLMVSFHHDMHKCMKRDGDVIHSIACAYPTYNPEHTLWVLRPTTYPGF